METSKPLPYEQSLPHPEKADVSDSLPPPVGVQEIVGLRVDQTAETPKLLEEAEFAKQAIEKRPEAVQAHQSHVEKAAEKNEAQEAVYELRHEIKDEPAQPMVSVGSVVADIPERQPAVAKAEQYMPKVSGSFSREVGDLLQLPDSQNDSIFRVYRRPMLIGFVTALTGLGLYIIYSLITN